MSTLVLSDPSGNSKFWHQPCLEALACSLDLLPLVRHAASQGLSELRGAARFLQAMVKSCDFQKICVRRHECLRSCMTRARSI